MKIAIYQVDAFADEVFTGNPAAVCVLQEWLPDRVMQQIAAENNLSETAFLVGQGGCYRIRWFTPTLEVDLCGHATLAAAYVLFELLGYQGEKLSLQANHSCLYVVNRGNGCFAMDFPAMPAQPCELVNALERAFAVQPLEVLRSSTDDMLVLASEAEVRLLAPDLGELRSLTSRGVIVTALGQHVDFVSRFFAPQSGIDEDPVTGSAHCTLAPYWAEKLAKHELIAKQLSPRGGILKCSLSDGRVTLVGKARLYLEGYIHV